MLARVTPPERVSVVVPVYNGAGTLAELVERIGSALAGHELEIVLVNDGSDDASWARIQELARANPKVRGLDLSRNFGQHNALLAGVREATGSLVVTLDDDLQHPPEEIPVLLAALGDDVDLIYGTPAIRHHGLWRNVASRLVRIGLQSAVGSPMAAVVSPFRVFRVELRDAFDTFGGPYVSLDVLLSWATTRFQSIPVAHADRAAGTSTYTFRKLVSLALTMLTGFSTRPLRIASLVGLLATMFGLLVLAYVVVRLFVSGNPVPGFPFLASIVAILSGAQLLTLGVIGEYLGRVHTRSMNKPAYVVRTATGTESRGADALAPAHDDHNGGGRSGEQR